MKTILLATAVVAIFAATANLSPAFAAEPGASGSTTVMPAFESNSLSGQAAMPHYQGQYHYVGRHARFESYWALVK